MAKSQRETLLTKTVITGLTGRLSPNNGRSKSLSKNFKIRPNSIVNIIVLPRLSNTAHPKIEIFLLTGSPSSLIQVVVK
jgi:hypothetical protein